MSFNSFQFWLVYPCLFLAYWLIPERKGKLRKWYLIAVSYLLYMNWRPAFALVLLGVSLITYVGGDIYRKDPWKEVLHFKRMVASSAGLAASAHLQVL